VDTGSVSNAEGMPYLSDRQTGMFRRPTLVTRARICSVCGYAEFFVDPAALRKNIGG
jgi:hypothetical protein